MQPLPTPDNPTTGETLQAYALRLLGFVLSTGITATLSDRQLELADHCYPYAISNPDLLDTTREQFTSTRRQIMAALAFRRSLTSIPVAVPEPAQPERTPIGGQLTPLRPRPQPQPPRPTAADLAF